MPKYQPLFLGQFKPEGSLKQLILKELQAGFIGSLDELVPNLLVEDDIYSQDRRNPGQLSPDLGILLAAEAAPEPQHMWWNSESSSNWLDGLFRCALLTEEKNALQKAEKIIAQRLESQDLDGYMGIYQKDSRFPQGVENGELWALSSLLRVLIAYYEANTSSSLLDKIQQAANCLMNSCPINNARPFSAQDAKPEENCSGLSHGLTLTDAFYRLYGLTQDKKYLDYCLFLYESYSEEPSPQLEPDIRECNLLLNSKSFCGHGVHTYEHLRALTVYASHKPEKGMPILKAYLEKLTDYLLPSGAPSGDEMIRHRPAHSSYSGYEYCSIQELFDAYRLLLQESGDLGWADKMEWLFHNAAMGARHPKHSAVAYLKNDNSYAMTGREACPEAELSSPVPQTRYKYSPVHQDVAVCCVPNAGRILAYYPQYSWFSDERGLYKLLYGAGILRTQWGTSQVSIEESSHYPLGNRIDIRISVSEPVQFCIAFRRPAWWHTLKVTGAPYREENQLLIFEQLWSGETIISLDFKQEVKRHQDHQKQQYFSWGALLLALPIAAKEVLGREYAAGFVDRYYYPLSEDYNHLHLSPKSALPKVEILPDGLRMKLEMIDLRTGQSSQQTLQPIAETLLRKVTFSGYTD